MEKLLCPICGKKNLINSRSNDVPTMLVECSNENYIHWSLAGAHFLSKTKDNELAEMDDLLSSVKEFAIN